MRRTSKGKTYPPEVLTAAEVKALLNTCSPRSATGTRNKALIVLLWRTGLRIAEALDLKPGDVSAINHEVYVRRGKGSKYRTVPIDDSTLAYVGRWLDQRSARGFKGRSPLFCTLAGTPIHGEYVRAMLDRCRLKAELDRERVNPHAFRHTYAAELYREGTPLPTIQKLLGHASLDATASYLGRIAPVELVDVILARPDWED